MSLVKTTQGIGFKRNLSLFLIISLFVIVIFACKSNTSLVEDRKLQQPENELAEKSPKQTDYNTDDLFLWKKPLEINSLEKGPLKDPLVDGVFFSGQTKLEDKLFFYDPVRKNLHRLNISNGRTELVITDHKTSSFLPGESSIFRYNVSKEHEDRRVILEKVSLPDMQIQWQHIMDRPNWKDINLYKNMVLYGSYNGYIYALNIDDGSLCWRFSLEEAAGKGFYPYAHEDYPKNPISPHSTLYIHEDTLYCHYNGVKENQGWNKGILFAIDLSTHKLEWKLLTNGEIVSKVFFDDQSKEKKLIFITFIRNTDVESSNIHILSTIYTVNRDTGLAEQMDVSYPGIGSGRTLINVSNDLFIVGSDGKSPLKATSRKDTSQLVWETADSLYWSGSITRAASYLYTIHQVSPSKHQMRYELLLLEDIDSMKIQIVELESGKHIATWALSATLHRTFISIAQADTLAIVSDKKGIYALDLEKVLTRWLETKETIEIVTGNE